MNPPDDTHADVDAVRKVIHAVAAAVRAQDVEAMLAHCAPDVVVFDMLAPMIHAGTDALRELWTRTLGALVPPVEYELHRLQIHAGRYLAVAHSLNRFGGTTRDGTRNVSWLRSTLGLRRIEGQWKIVHQHVSVPYDMATGQALLGLEP